MLEQSVWGWKEFELEVMRDQIDNVVIICSIENFDPMGIHTGDSITVAPQQTLSDREYQNLRDLSIKIIRKIGVETGGSNIQFAVNPSNGQVMVIEMNPRVSRSSALASKATGFPIAKIAALLSIGYNLDEVTNDITKTTPASFEPALDYVVTKIPCFVFEKFPATDSTLGVQMKSVGEVMAIGRNFKESFQKAIRSLESGRFGFGSDGNFEELIEILNYGSEKLKEHIQSKLSIPNYKRIFYIKLAFSHNFTVDEIYNLTHIDKWFLYQLLELHQSEKVYTETPKKQLLKMKRFGFSNRQLAYLLSEEGVKDILKSSQSIEKKRDSIFCFLQKKENEIMSQLSQANIKPVYKLIDTCAGEFQSYTPYFYSTYESENECRVFSKKSVMVIGSGPNRIGQGVEFDYCCCHASLALQKMDFESIMVNSNPETVSTDYDISNRLYFEPITLENVLNIYEMEKPIGVILQFGGQTPLKLVKELQKRNIKILGTSPDSIDRAEDRNRFSQLLKKLDLKTPLSHIAVSKQQAIEISRKMNYPILVRPSYVLGGRSMMIVDKEQDLESYMNTLKEISDEQPLLIDTFIENALEIDVDAICDGEQLFVAGIMEHIEEAGIHSGDSACVFPVQSLERDMIENIEEQTKKIALELSIIGLLNIQYIIKDGNLYVIEVNPRSSRTVPFISKATGIPLVQKAVQVIMGEKLRDLDLLQNDFIPKNINIKEAVFPFNKFLGEDILLGPEMKSTGEVMGIGESLEEAFLKSQIMAGQTIPKKNGIFFVSIHDKLKEDLMQEMKILFEMGFSFIATKGTQEFLSKNGILSSQVNKIHVPSSNIIELIKQKKIDFIINIPLSKISIDDSFLIRQQSIKSNIPYITTNRAVKYFVQSLFKMQNQEFKLYCLQNFKK